MFISLVCGHMLHRANVCPNTHMIILSSDECSLRLPPFSPIQGVADVLVAPSTPEMRDIGWGRETRLALDLLSKTLLDWMDEAEAAGGGEDGANPDDGYFSMSAYLAAVIVADIWPVFYTVR